MGVWRFRGLVGAIVFANVYATTPSGALVGAFLFFPLAFALSPLAPGNGLTPSWVPFIVFWGIAFLVAFRAGRGLFRGWKASREGNHNGARAAALKGFAYAGITSFLALSLMSLADAWPA